MNNIFYTSVEQSRKLLELGLNENTADMCYEYIEECDGNFPYYSEPSCHKQEESNDIPCWSVGALINAMPKIITVNNQECYLRIYHTILGSIAIEYSTFEENTLQYFDDKDLLAVIYYMTCWLLENNYIKKE